MTARAPGNVHPLAQEDCFKKIKKSRQEVFGNDRTLSIEKGIRFVSGNLWAPTTAEGEVPLTALQKVGFQRNKLNLYVGGLIKANVLSTDTTHELARPYGALEPASWGRSATSARMASADKEFCNRLRKVRDTHDLRTCVAITCSCTPLVLRVVFSTQAQERRLRGV